MRGLEITFTESLHRTPSGVSPGGAIFPFEVVQTFDLQKGTVVLRPDYHALVQLGDDLVIFQSEAPHTMKMYVSSSIIASIKDLSKNKVLYPKE
jgi:hypothetical protein